MAGRSRKRKRNTAAEDRDFLHYLKIAIAVMVLLLIVLASYFGYHFGRQVFTDESLADKKGTVREYVLEVAAGESTLQVGIDLEKHGIIESALAYTVQTKIYQGKIAPGSYTVSSEKSSKEIVKYLNTEYEKTHQEETK